MLSPSAVRLAAGILLLAPRIPLIFMGEEYGETHPFPFFCDFKDPELIRAVREGRKAEFSYFGWETDILDPCAPSTRDTAVLSWSWETPVRLGLRNLYRDLLRLRREEPVLSDFSHARTRLIGVGESDIVLEVLRGGSTDDEPPRIQIYLNLGGERERLPDGWQGRSPRFRSEVEKYGGAGHEGDVWDGTLHPHEFVILGSGSSS
jgi:maltooligosyltrehalose trehalohydrolase